MSLHTLVGLSEFPLLQIAFSYLLPISFIGVYDVFWLNCRRALYILENTPLSVLDIANIFFESFLSLQPLPMTYFIENKSSF